ncbi:MAG TPA: glycosyltransferase [Vicinamibacterales bacterium]|nr:glycosyltransferase [Vicinamibacterales bacterium]
MKPRVMVFSRCYLPGFRGGGPVRSLVNLVHALGAEMDFRIITRDRDEGADQPYASLSPGTWQAVGAAQVCYVPQSVISIRWLAREVAAVSPQLLYLNSFFDSIFTLKVLLARRARMFPPVPMLLAPQGELSAGALSIKSLKKAAYIRVARWCGLYRGLTWQASNVAERADILKVMGTVASGQIRVAADLTEEGDLSPAVRAPRSVSQVLRLCFLSRISPKKNLDFALRVLADVNAPVEFTIYGPVEDTSFWATCQQLIARLPSHIRVHYGGELLPQHVRHTLSEYDLFFFPTRGENFGHVIFEALLAGVPVLISDQTPWADLEAHGAGWSFPLHSTAAFVAAIEAAARELPNDREGAASRAIAYAAWRVDRRADVKAAHDLFRSLISP